jgi:hypothetical protein
MELGWTVRELLRCQLSISSLQTGRSVWYKKYITPPACLDRCLLDILGNSFNWIARYASQFTYCGAAESISSPFVRRSALGTPKHVGYFVDHLGVISIAPAPLSRLPVTSLDKRPPPEI